MLRFILQGMMDGHCDLDLFLDPFVIHFPSPVEMRPWYTGLGDPQEHTQPDLSPDAAGFI